MASAEVGFFRLKSTEKHCINICECLWHILTMAASFEHPSIDWDKAESFREFRRFERHVGFVFNNPLEGKSEKQQAGCLGSWIGTTGHEICKTFDWADGEKDQPKVILQIFENYLKPRKNKRVVRHKLKNRKLLAGESFDMSMKVMTF